MGEQDLGAMPGDLVTVRLLYVHTVQTVHTECGSGGRRRSRRRERESVCVCVCEREREREGDAGGG